MFPQADSAGKPPADGAAFSAEETHGIALWPGNRLIAHSQELGWRNLYASLAREEPWAATLRPVPHYCLAYCLHGHAAIARKTDDGRPAATAILRPRQFGLVPADVPSHWQVQGSPDVLLLYVRRSLVDRLAEEMLQIEAARIELHDRIGIVDPFLEQMALSILGAMRQGEPDGLYIDAVTQAVAVQLLRTHTAGAARKAGARPALDRPPGLRLRRVVDYIEAALDEALSLESLAREAGLSTHHLARAFRRELGEPVHQYILRRRIERAKQMLTHTDLPVAEVALATGFSSQSHLTSVFKRQVGVTPAGYRRGGAR